MGEVNVGQALDLISSDRLKDRVEGLGGNEAIPPSSPNATTVLIIGRFKTYSP